MSSIRFDLAMYFRDFVTTLVNARFFPTPFRSRVLRIIGYEVDPSARISPDCFLGSFRRLSIGRSTFINYGCFFELSAETRLGDNCDIGFQVKFITSTHELGAGSRRAGAHIATPITVGDGVWVGAGAIILPGVTIGSGCVIGAGAVVIADCDDNCLYVGVPARKVRFLGEAEKRSECSA